MEEVPLAVLLDEIKRRIVSARVAEVPILPCGHRCSTCDPDATAAGANVTQGNKKLRKKEKVSPSPTSNAVHTVFEFDFCSAHSEEVDHWCCRCQGATCKNCPEAHYGHGIVLAKDMFQQEVRSKLEEVDFEADEGRELSASVTASIDDCDEGLRLIKEATGLRKQLLRRKNYLLRSQEVLQEFMEAMPRKEADSSLQAKHWKLLKVMSRATEHFKQMESELRIMCTALSQFGTTGRLEKTHQTLRDRSAILFPRELLPSAASWTLHGEYEARKALGTLRTSKNRPSGPVTVISSSEKPILSLSELLINLAEDRYMIKVKLLDSFLAKTAPPNDYNRLEPFLKDGHGQYLLSLMGHLTPAAFDGLNARYLRKVGLRLDTAADAAVLCAQPYLKCFRHIRVSRSVLPDDIKESLPEGSTLVSFHFVGLLCCDFHWLKAVLGKLVPPKRKASVYFPESSLTAAAVQHLLEMMGDLGVIPWVWMESSTLTEDEKKALDVAAENVKIELKWKFQFL